MPFTVAAALTPIQIGVGVWAAHFVADNQPIKLAAMQGVFETQRYAIKIPSGLSLLAHFDLQAEVLGLNEVPPDLRPPVNVVHLAFQAMVGCGFALLALSVWLAIGWWRRKDLPTAVWFLRAAALSGILAVIALEAGWVVTEVGRRPWIVYGDMLTPTPSTPPRAWWSGSCWSAWCTRCSLSRRSTCSAGSPATFPCRWPRRSQTSPPKDRLRSHRCRQPRSCWSPPGCV